MIMTVLRQQPRAAGLVLGLIAANFLAWCWALQAFGDSGALMAASLLAWCYGLRHAVDAEPARDGHYAFAVGSGSSDCVQFPRRQGCSSSSPWGSDHPKLTL